MLLLGTALLDPLLLPGMTGSFRRVDSCCSWPASFTAQGVMWALKAADACSNGPARQVPAPPC